MVSVKPIVLVGCWEKGYALDIHTISSQYIGDNEYGHPQYKTKYTELGELVLKLKYRNDKSAIYPIEEAMRYFLKNTWKILEEIHYIIPTPPSNTDREFQPVIEIATLLSKNMSIPLCTDSLIKKKATKELKDIVNPETRKEILKDAFSIDTKLVVGKNILLVDDLFRSGATLQTITEVLYNEGKAKKVYVITATKTRSNR
jgi:competence protein ComFC